MAQETPLSFDFVAAARRFQQDLKIYAPVIFGGLTILNSAKLNLITIAQDNASLLFPHIGALSQINWGDVKRRLDELPEKSKSAMTQAAAKGWFFGWNDSLQSLIELVEKLDEVQESAIDEVLAQYYRDNLQSLTDELTSRHPARASVIKAAVSAHRTLGEDGYLLSIPVFIEVPPEIEPRAF